MKTIYLLDRLVPKHIVLKWVDDSIEIAQWEYVTYKLPDDHKTYVWLHVGFEIQNPDKEWKFVEVLTGEWKEKFMNYQKKAEKYYDIFKKEFPIVCPWATPVVSRVDLQWQNIYFYFYAEERYNFSDFVRHFRTIVPVQFFIYQLWARDMIRYSPAAKECLIACGCGPLWCSGLWKLPSVEMDNITLQGLEWRDVEKLKWRCGKLKCSMVFERELYLEETAQFPKKGAVWTMNGHKCTCIWYNIMNWEVVAKTQEWEILRWQKQTFHLDSPVSSHV
jgi:cell fate regulator YaaT (PSP1 superfamily)